jgi:hypothetical protein
MTVAEKDRSIETPRFTGLPLVLPGRSSEAYPIVKTKKSDN